MTEKIKRLVESAIFRRMSVSAIIFSSLLIGLETFEGMSGRLKALFKAADQIILFWFVVEISLRVLSFGKKPQHFFRNGWNIFDFLIVAISVCPAASPAFAVFRLFRVFRVLRMISGIPDLQILVEHC